MSKVDKQMITLYKIKDDKDVRCFSAVSGESKGVATVLKQDLSYSYSGDSLLSFDYFLEDLMTRSVKEGKELPDKIVHGFG